MKYLLMIIFFSQVGVYNQGQIEEKSNLVEGIYYGKSGFFIQKHLFVKVLNDKAIVECYIKEKLIYKKFSDTLEISRTDNMIAKGKVSEIMEGNRGFYIQSRMLGYPVRIKRNDERFRNWETFRNLSYFEKEKDIFYNDKSNIDERSTLFNKLIQKYSIWEKAYILSHEDFRREFEKLKIELKD
jgi:hypothetical protein